MMSRFGHLSGMSRIGVVAALAAATTLSATPTHAAKHKAASTEASAGNAKPADKTGVCGPSPDQASVGMRALQTELMVAGLKCSAEQWNNFTAKFKATIKTDADRLQRLFQKSYGAGGANRMNTFVTQLANDASQRSNAFTEADYCKQQDVVFQKVLALTALELERFAAMRDLAVPAPVALCKADPAPTGATTVSATIPPTTTASVASDRPSSTTR